MRIVSLQIQDHSLVNTIKLGYCTTFWDRLRGWMFRNPIQPEQGLILVQSRSSRMDSAIHMFFVNFDLCVLWLDDNWKIVDKILARRWRPFYAPNLPARYVIEIHPKYLPSFEIGQTIILTNE